MRRGRILKSTILVLAFVGVGIQFVPVDKTNPPVVSALHAPAPVDSILRRACYDCHSHETRWPWYARVAPASWFLARHVHRGRAELNFSDWPEFDFHQQDMDMREMWSEVKEGDMPRRSYLWIHRDARLSEQDRATLRRWLVE